MTDLEKATCSELQSTQSQVYILFVYVDVLSIPGCEPRHIYIVMRPHLQSLLTAKTGPESGVRYFLRQSRGLKKKLLDVRMCAKFNPGVGTVWTQENPTAPMVRWRIETRLISHI